MATGTKRYACEATPYTSKNPPAGRSIPKVSTAARRAQRAARSRRRRRRLLGQVRNFDQIRQDIVTVVTQQRMAVEQERVERPDDHDIHAQRTCEARLAEPPEARGYRGQQDLDIDARRGHGRTAHLLANIQESETSQYRQGAKTSNIGPISWHSPPKRRQASAVPQLVHDLDQGNRDHGQDGVSRRDETLPIGKPRRDTPQKFVVTSSRTATTNASDNVTTARRRTSTQRFRRFSNGVGLIPGRRMASKFATLWNRRRLRAVPLPDRAICSPCPAASDRIRPSRCRRARKACKRSGVSRRGAKRRSKRAIISAADSPTVEHFEHGQLFVAEAKIGEHHGILYGPTAPPRDHLRRHDQVRPHVAPPSGRLVADAGFCVAMVILVFVHVRQARRQLIRGRQARRIGRLRGIESLPCQPGSQLATSILDLGPNARPGR